MIHLPTAAGGRVEHLVRAGTIAPRGTALVRVHPPDGPPEVIASPIDALVAVQRLRGAHAPRYARIVGLRRVVLATARGRVTRIATLGPIGVTTMIALVDTGEGVRTHRAGGVGFVGQRFVNVGQTIELGHPLIEIRGEDLF